MTPQTNGHQELRDVARYVTDMTAQMEKMAASVGLEALAYFLGLAKAEGELLVHRMAQPESSVDTERIEPIDPETDSDDDFR